MVATILGGYPFTSKTGKSCYSVTCEIKRDNAVGITASSYMCLSERLPEPLDKMIGKKYICDTNQSFISDFYEVK